MSVLRKYERQNQCDGLGTRMGVRKIRKMKGKEDVKSLFTPCGTAAHKELPVNISASDFWETETLGALIRSGNTKHSRRCRHSSFLKMQAPVIHFYNYLLLYVKKNPLNTI